MKEFIQNCDYFIFSIIIFNNTYDISKIISASNSENVLVSEILDFNFISYKIIQDRISLSKRKIYLFTPKSNKNIILMVSNKEDGLDALNYYISHHLLIDFYIISISDIKSSEVKNSLTYIKNGKCKRIIYAMKDPKWIFYEEGNTLWFENTDYYKSRHIKDRLNKAIIIEYCYKLGFEILNEEFWCAEKAIFLEYL